MSSPSNTTRLPGAADTIPEMARSVDDLPAPLEPTSVAISPG